MLSLETLASALSYIPLQQCYNRCECVMLVSKRVYRCVALSVLHWRDRYSLLYLMDALAIYTQFSSESPPSVRMTKREVWRWRTFVKEGSSRSAKGVFASRDIEHLKETVNIVQFEESFQHVFAALVSPYRISRHNFPKLGRVTLSFPVCSVRGMEYSDRLLYWYDRPHPDTVWRTEMAQWLWSSYNKFSSDPSVVQVAIVGQFQDLLRMFHPSLDLAGLHVSLDLTLCKVRSETFPLRLEQICNKCSLYQVLHRLQYHHERGMILSSLCFDLDYLLCSRKPLEHNSEKTTEAVSIDIIPLSAVAELPRCVSPGSWHTSIVPLQDSLTDEELVRYLHERVPEHEWTTSARCFARRRSQNILPSSPSFEPPIHVMSSEGYLEDDTEHEVESDDDNPQSTDSEVETFSDYRRLSGSSSCRFLDWSVFEDFDFIVDGTRKEIQVHATDLACVARYANALHQGDIVMEGMNHVVVSTLVFDTLDLDDHYSYNASNKHQVRFFHQLVNGSAPAPPLVVYKILTENSDEFLRDFTGGVIVEELHLYSDVDKLFPLLTLPNLLAIGKIDLMGTEKKPVPVKKIKQLFMRLVDLGIDQRLLCKMALARTLGWNSNPSLSFTAQYCADSEEEVLLSDATSIQRIADQVFGRNTLAVTVTKWSEDCYDELFSSFTVDVVLPA